MPKGVRLTTDQFIENAVKFLSKKSADAQEIILSNIEKDLKRANKAENRPATGSTNDEAGETKPAKGKGKSKAKGKGKSKPRKPAQDAEPEPEPEPGE